ncbi:MAG: potassium channel protein [Chloroflexi bacterium]|nr:potassium channel protein [Chloroflexota bacterium]
MSDGQHLYRPAAVILAILALGTLGYIVIEGWGTLDALYMTVTTMATVGFGEIHPLTQQGRAFTIGLIVLGVGGALYLLTTMMQFVFEGHLGRNLERRRMDRRIEHLRDHFILCGLGRVGRQVARDFEDAKVPFVVIDSDQAAIDSLASLGYLWVRGDATDDDVLRRAGVERARGLVTCVQSDADNIFVTLSARALRSDLFIVARGNNDDATPKLRRAGADRVVSPYSIGGRQMAMLATRPAAVEFVDRVLGRADIDLLLEDVTVREGSILVGKTVREVGQEIAPGITILAIRRRLQLVTQPPPDAKVGAGDDLVAIGTSAQLEALEAVS